MLGLLNYNDVVFTYWPEKFNGFPVTMENIVDDYNNTCHDYQSNANKQHGVGKYYAGGQSV
jgi:hypothetical protein